MKSIYEGYASFVDDNEKMHDFLTMSMEDFLGMYSYLDKEDYYATYDELMAMSNERQVIGMTTLAEVMNGRFEDCMKDLYRNMSAWADEIYDTDEFNRLTDEQIRLVAEAIENCADLVKISAQEYGIEV